MSLVSLRPVSRLLVPLVCLALLAGTARSTAEAQDAGKSTEVEGADDKKVAPASRPAPPAAGPSPTEKRNPFRGGVCWVGSADPEGLEYLADQGVEWISVTPFAYGHKNKSLPPEGGYRPSRFRGESRGGISEVIDQAHALGVKVLLKPHIWFSTENAWRGDIAMESEKDWDTWFTMYEEFLAPFVALAAEKKVAAFCVGCELAGTIGRDDQWRALIARIREKYNGELTFAANWHREFEEIAFWDDLDWIGVQAYFPLTTSESPTEEQLCAGWARWKKDLAKVAIARKKPVVFTEIGYRPEVDNGREPWGWRITGTVDTAAQARAFSALFAALEGEEWLGGIHVWKWFAGYRGGEPPRRRRGGHDSFSPQGHPAEEVIFQTFRKWAKEREAQKAPVTPVPTEKTEPGKPEKDSDV